jgi:perosamine synthetase
MTFAATAEIVRYQGAVPILVDCDPITLNIDLDDAERKLTDLQAGRTPLDANLKPFGIMPVHVGGLMIDMDAVSRFANRHGLWVVEDAAHALPAAYRVPPVATGNGQRKVGRGCEAHRGAKQPACRGAAESQMGTTMGLEGSTHPTARVSRARPWRQCGANTAAVTCFSFYANKTMTTGEGGMAVTDDEELADRMRQMSLHGLSHGAWKRYSGNGSWDYHIVAPGYKYNMTDIAAAIGLHQLDRADAMRQEREAIAHYYLEAFADVEELELPPDPADRVHAWHLFPIRLRLEKMPRCISRNRFIELLRERGVGCSVHWRPLHLHPYYEQTFHWTREQFPVASAQWERLVSLPIFPGMRRREQEHVVSVVRRLCARRTAERARSGKRPRKPR